MSKTVISIENLTKRYDLGVIGTGTLSRDLNRWWARLRKQPDPYTRIGQRDHFERIGESILALDDVSFTVQQGEALGIIGKNGAGKSTLLKILSRVTAPTSGVVKVKGRIGSLLEVGTGFHPELTGRENVFLNGAILGMRKDEVQRKFDEIVDFAGVEKFIDTPVKRYSSGMYVRLAFAVAAHLDPEILVVDEVLAVGDAEFQKKCLGKMGDVAGEGRTVLFVSHNMRSINELCKSSILLNDGKIDLFGNTNSVIDQYLYFKKDRGRKMFAIDVIDRTYRGPHEILSVWIENHFGVEQYQFNQGDDVVFCIKIQSNYQPVIIGISVKDIHNQSIVFLSNLNDKVTLMPENKECVIKVKFENLLLRSGDYFITYVLNDGHNQFCDRWRDVISLNISDINSGVQLTFAPYIFHAKWKIK